MARWLLAPVLHMSCIGEAWPKCLGPDLCKWNEVKCTGETFTFGAQLEAAARLEWGSCTQRQSRGWSALLRRRPVLPAGTVQGRVSTACSIALKRKAPEVSDMWCWQPDTIQVLHFYAMTSPTLAATINAPLKTAAAD